MKRERVDLTKIRTIPLNARKCKVSIKEFAKVTKKGSSFKSFYDSLPDVLASQNLRFLTDKIVEAYKKDKMVILMMGAHVIKCGLSPLVIDLMRRGVIKAVAFNGAGIIHDTEIAMIGRTSEDVGEGILDGSFGMAKETASFINGAINDGFTAGLGIGEAVGGAIVKARLPHRDLSILATGSELNIPVTAHVAIGTDIIHQHPSFDGALAGEGSLRDFHILTENLSQLNNGGVVLNFGSAVILPEVFLKALNLGRNLGHKIKDFVAANFDMIYHYRPLQNVVSRPVMSGGKGYYIVGHHEIMLPLLAQAVIEKI